MTPIRATAETLSAKPGSELRRNAPFSRNRVATTHKSTRALALVFGFRSHRLARLAERAAEVIRGCFRPGLRTQRGQAERGSSKTGLSVAAESGMAADGRSVDAR